MGSNQIKCCLILVVLLIFIFTSLLTSTSISGLIYNSQCLSERRLLQVVKSCPIDFEHQNYSIITSKCKAPKYPVNPCCSALKEFACPFAEELDDATNDCANRMFQYIKHIGHYPNGLFASVCQEGQGGLLCPPKKSKKNNGNRKIITCDHNLLTFLVLLVWFV
ncbi:GPI-anchored protein lorelei [Phtheirospermum japonicum]|uniref:GPI-anchored protein lorelei n=1 Tax=Phtheirospermum japonicum TaxID=374723 RepID=A0A830CNV5_9LAMI|nr:GPI-anchored protein lorelei [Phtheirospermum japonicum]